MVKIDDTYQLERFSKTEEEFETFYETELNSKLAELEKERLETIQLAKKLAMKCILPFVGVLLFFFVIKDFAGYAVIAFILFAGYLFKDVVKKRKELSKKIKAEIVTDLVRFINPNFTYEPNKHLSQSEFRYANVFRHKPNRFTGDDLIKGYVGSDVATVGEFDSEPTKTDLKFSEVKAEKVEKYRDKDGKTRERVEVIFKGLFFKADFNKDFDGVTIVVPKEKRSKIKRKKGVDESRILQEVELENPDFMDKFTVRSNDQITSRYILTPSFMHRLLEFTNRQPSEIKDFQKPKSIKEAFQLGLDSYTEQQSNYTNTPYFSFRDGTMYFLLPTDKKHFEFNILFPLNKALIQSYFKDLNLALELVDELNLNLRIWNKE